MSMDKMIGGQSTLPAPGRVGKRPGERGRTRNNGTNAPVILEKLQRMRVELIDQAFVLECQGRLDAADVAISTASRLAGMCEELAPFAAGRRRSC